jgi:hypothetical protein
MSPSIVWSMLPSCAGGSSAITRNSSRRSAWDCVSTTPSRISAVVEPGAIAAAVEAEAQAASRRHQVRDALVRHLEAARYSFSDMIAEWSDTSFRRSA